MHLTAGKAIEKICTAAGVSPKRDTVDTIKCGNPESVVTGIVVTFMATRDVIAAAMERGANFIITHEPTFYSHLDATDWLGNYPVFQAKKSVLDQSKLVLWRFHDMMHGERFDLIDQGVEEHLGWAHWADRAVRRRYVLPRQTLGELVSLVKSRFGVPQVRVVGDLNMPCAHVALLVGAWGGSTQIGMLARPDIDVVICGETAEWETIEYARDSASTDSPKAVIVVGHQPSEEPGMQWLAEFIRPLFPGIAVHHIAAGFPIKYC